ncbi:MAG: hypothetical protein AAFN10_00995, partial [Bacteroidota bacterium]
MKSHLLFLILSLGIIQGLWAQNPIVQYSQFAYDFGTDSYLLTNENSYQYNEAEELIFRRSTTWQKERTYPNQAFETSYTYHPDGTISSRNSRNYRLDTLDGGYWAQYDTRGDLIQDSSYYRNQEGEIEYYVSRYL